MIGICFEHVTKIYDKKEKALQDVTFSVNQGEFVFIIGESGAGKSTIIKLLSRQEKINSGDIFVWGESINELRENQIPHFRRQLGILSADIPCLNGMTVLENVRLALTAVGEFGKRAEKKAMEALSIVGMCSKKNMFPSELSGGEKSRVLLARAIVVNPLILLADEPTANLDADASWDFMCLLEEINRKGVTVLVSTHSTEMVTLMRKRVIQLEQGKLKSDRYAGIYLL